MAVQLALLNDAVNPGAPSHPWWSLPAAEWDEGLSPAMPPLHITAASPVPMVTPYPSADFFSLFRGPWNKTNHTTGQCLGVSVQPLPSG